MKIDFISSSLDGGGAERVMVLLANFFITQGHDVTIITLKDGDDFHFHERVKRTRLHFGAIRNHTLRGIYNLISYYRNKKNRPAIAISFLSRTNFMSIIACKMFSIKIIASEHFNHLGPGDKIRTFTWNYLYKKADAITVLTKFDRLFFERKGARVFVMPNPSTFTPITENTLPRRKVILAIGCLDRYHDKGFDNLIKLISPVLKQYPDWMLKIVGKGEAGLRFLEELAIKEGVKQQIIFTGFRKDVNELMKGSEVFILSSRSEGLPMVLLEAMSQGMACIAYDCITGPSEMIINNQNGLLISDQNMQEMQKGLIKLIEDEKLRRKLGESALNNLDRYSIENIYKLWNNVFQQVM
jgi:GalNAc-alpha-(1->4)-GalNAc-alpha-(1->3)-diNAcBac-PP-undecaprenol alpha-1,4-N-acetyl-D-galactosaminyltransferase